ncbi:MAG: hypothetical protein J2O46_01305, partial [Nocardioides sp.]|nr:hypothetical protein [Nocardioides sp.]
ARSHLHDGRVVAWTGPYDHPVAIDAEVDRPVPAALARRFGTHDFWRRWTRAECVAKLTGQGVVRLLAILDEGDPPQVDLVTHRLKGDIIVSVGTLRDVPSVTPPTVSI